MMDPVARVALLISVPLFVIIPAALLVNVNVAAVLNVPPEFTMILAEFDNAADIVTVCPERIVMIPLVAAGGVTVATQAKPFQVFHCVVEFQFIVAALLW
jgi:hypothetical protein